MTYVQRLEAKERAKANARRERERERLTRFICEPCRRASKEKRTHPGVQHVPGICDCPCR